jgi:two-component system, NtrC family, sensor kinase
MSTEHTHSPLWSALCGTCRDSTQVQELLKANEELSEVNRRLSAAQEKLVQSEKLASIGQLAAGVAHEINNPIGYIFSNFGTLEKYLDQLFLMIKAYEEVELELKGTALADQLRIAREELEVDFLKEDIPSLMNESREGIIRVRKIVQDLKDFSRVDASQEWVWANLHRGIDSTLNIVNNEIKYKAEVLREYGEIPDIECLPSELNQVFMNLLVNAAHAITADRGTITIRTGSDEEQVWVEVSDSGCGIPKEILGRIFDPFFTTKPVGKGTGLGLSLAYGIIQKHRGNIEVRSQPGEGTTFRVSLPIRHNVAKEAA